MLLYNDSYQSHSYFGSSPYYFFLQKPGASQSYHSLNFLLEEGRAYYVNKVDFLPAFPTTPII